MAFTQYVLLAKRTEANDGRGDEESRIREGPLAEPTAING